jgi:hypothetical protein
MAAKPAVAGPCVDVAVVALVPARGINAVACDRAGRGFAIRAGSDAGNGHERRTPMPDKMKRFTSWNVKYNAERIDAESPVVQVQGQALTLMEWSSLGAWSFSPPGAGCLLAAPCQLGRSERHEKWSAKGGQFSVARDTAAAKRAGASFAPAPTCVLQGTVPAWGLSPKPYLITTAFFTSRNPGVSRR